MKKVLWISRHQMTEEQTEDLTRVFKDEISIVQYKDTVKNIMDLQEYIKEADIIAAVLPINKMYELFTLAEGKPLIQAVSKRIPTGKIITTATGSQEQEFMFVHCYWEQIIRLEYEILRLE